MECKAKVGHKLGSDLTEILEKRQAKSECSEEDAEAFLQNTQDTIDVTKMLSRKEIKEHQKLFSRYVAEESITQILEFQIIIIRCHIYLSLSVRTLAKGKLKSWY